ncbi:hypothetical protein Ari01nite_82190 [Paractinoplanes rishiriensis]|uniref:Uncharacterized protein n=1 Tax=Paractinoplanes rishiriensis TaxID=1050105 RepID=A0A919K6W7_9ACTN|nr:hypothetical protein Ari01nite_82190 [Actinoplanes rishiriensis]
MAALQARVTEVVVAFVTRRSAGPVGGSEPGGGEVGGSDGGVGLGGVGLGGVGLGGVGLAGGGLGVGVVAAPAGTAVSTAPAARSIAADQARGRSRDMPTTLPKPSKRVNVRTGQPT